MSIYPSFEDMVVHQMMTAQSVPSVSNTSAASSFPEAGPWSTAPSPWMCPSPQTSGAPSTPFAGEILYPSLGPYMGLEFTENEMRNNMPQYLNDSAPSVTWEPSSNITSVASSSSVALPFQRGPSGVIAPLSSNNLPQLSHGVRQIILCKDGNGKVGLRVKSIDKGIFVCLVTKGSPAALGGLRFGDQILQINGENVAGFSAAKVHDIFKKAGVNNIVLAVRDRPFERCLTLHKDSTGHLGFQFRDGKITSIAINSSAARNGLLIEHNLLEIDGQNVVGMKDKEVRKIIDEGGSTINVTVIPTYIFRHMMKNMSDSIVQKLMDHSTQEL